MKMSLGAFVHPHVTVNVFTLWLRGDIKCSAVISAALGLESQE